MESNKFIKWHPCKKCGCVYRYAADKDRQCVECKRRMNAAAYQQAKARKQAAERHGVEVV